MYSWLHVTNTNAVYTVNVFFFSCFMVHNEPTPYICGTAAVEGKLIYISDDLLEMWLNLYN